MDGYQSNMNGYIYIYIYIYIGHQESTKNEG